MDFLNKAKDLANQHEEQVDQAVDRIGEEIDKRTDGKYGDQIDKGVAAVQNWTGEDEKPA